MIRRLGIGILALFAVAILLAACGPTTREDIAKTYVNEIVSGDSIKAAEYWSPVVDGKAYAANDAKIIAGQIKAMDVETSSGLLDHTEYVQVRARVQTKEGQEKTCVVRFDFVQADGSWKISSTMWLGC